MANSQKNGRKCNLLRNERGIGSRTGTTYLSTIPTTA